MKRALMLASSAFLASVTSAPAFGPLIEGYRVDGYLDQAPAGAKVVEKIEIVRPGGARTLHVVSYEDVSVSSGCWSCAPVFGQEKPVNVMNFGAAAKHLFEKSEGAHVTGLFVRPGLSRDLYAVEEIEATANEASDSEG